MTKPLPFTQAGIKRAIRAAKQEGATAVELRPDGRLFIQLSPQSPQPTDDAVEPMKEIIL